MQLLLATTIASLTQHTLAAEPGQVQTTAQTIQQTGLHTDMTARQILVMLNLPAEHFRPDVNYSGNYKNDAGSSARRRMAKDIAQKYKLKMVEDWAMPALSVDCYVMEAEQDGQAQASVDLLNQDASVAWAQTIEPFSAMAAADPLYPVQPSAKYWHLSELHKWTTGRNVRVAVIDSGIDSNHPDLTGQVVLKENFIDGNPYVAEEHGTQVAGIIAALAGNGIGIAGIAPEAPLLALRACWQMPASTACNSFTLGKAMNFAILNNAQIINLSLSGPSNKLLQRLVQVAQARGIVIVAATNADTVDGGFPAAYPGVLAVSDIVATDRNATILVAPGADIPTTTPGARWILVSGSSFATAHISGLAALLIQLRPTLKPAQLQRELKSHSIEGNVDACAVIQKITGQSCSQ
jgi:subtilisin family serine protease